MSLERPRPSSSTPQWDMNVVLKFLSGHFFEPLAHAELKFLSLKAAFLLAVASTQRRSELHALSSDNGVFSADKAVLKVVPGFLAKTSLPALSLNQLQSAPSR